mmetsp:Transcript_20690/g.53652  ORF Transcript_20690/g.53652 Transcript_20690/m.53652 type:complete len:208 (-) Transcript_20690:365-988(-)
MCPVEVSPWLAWPGPGPGLAGGGTLPAALIKLRTRPSFSFGVKYSSSSACNKPPPVSEVRSLIVSEAFSVDMRLIKPISITSSRPITSTCQPPSASGARILTAVMRSTTSRWGNWKWKTMFGAPCRAFTRASSGPIVLVTSPSCSIEASADITCSWILLVGNGSVSKWTPSPGLNPAAAWTIPALHDSTASSPLRTTSCALLAAHVL